jgi:hypothetical protein
MPVVNPTALSRFSLLGERERERERERESKSLPETDLMQKTEP